MPQGHSAPVRQRSGLRDIAHQGVRYMIWTSNLSTLFIVVVACHWTGTLRAVSTFAHMFIQVFDHVVFTVFGVWWRALLLLLSLNLLYSYIPYSVADSIDTAISWLIPRLEIVDTFDAIGDKLATTIERGMLDKYHNSLLQRLQQQDGKIEQLANRVTELEVI